MTVITIPENAPMFMINTTDISGSKVSGISYIGAKIFNVDTNRWYILGSDLKLKECLIVSGSYTYDSGSYVSGVPLY